jgi:CDP-diacylglycerol--glycerol-3-phosphate 3-phosphatidyltransferase
MWTIPNQITFFRIILIPVFLIIFYLPVSWSHFGAAFVFWLASISDALDGYLARKLKMSSTFGAFIDPVADKLMVSAALVILIEHYQSWWITIPALLMIGREILISALREFMADRGKRGQVAVSQLGKFKTAAQMLALIGLIWQPDYDVNLGIVFSSEFINGAAWCFYFIATILTCWSMFDYLRAAWTELTAS